MITVSLIRIALSALWANRLRSGLTLLGVIIGVTSVMTIISALEGMMGAIEEDLAVLGPTTFIVQRFGMTTSEAEFLEMLKRKPLNLDAVDLLEKGCDLCEEICPRSGDQASIKRGPTTMRRVYVGGSTANMLDIVDMEVAQGRFHSHEDDTYRRRVAFIGDLVREELFGPTDPLGKAIRIGGQKYTVCGVAKKRGSMFGESQDDFIFVPFSTHLKQFGQPGNRLRFMIKAVSVERLEDAQDQVRMVLRSRRHVPFDKPDDFAIMTADSILDFLNSITRAFRLALVGISSISLVVGGIVVMNIMMVSVTERTREIGIRKAIGARQKHIMLQFLFEALFTTLSGGLVGIALGYVIAESLVGMIDMQISPSAFAILSGLAISIGVGVIFGLYPAMKAARLDPIKALSYE